VVQDGASIQLSKSAAKLPFLSSMEKTNSLIKLVFTGPESSGKTTLAKSLAAALQAPLVPEFSRPFLTYLGRNYQYNDLKTIYTGQQAWENWYQRQRPHPYLVCDTDWTVIRIWELYSFGTTKITAQAKSSPNTHYFLCAPDFPWEPDALREHPAERNQLFELYKQLLGDLNAKTIILNGTPTERLKKVVELLSV